MGIEGEERWIKVEVNQRREKEEEKIGGTQESRSRCGEEENRIVEEE